MGCHERSNFGSRHSTHCLQGNDTGRPTFSVNHPGTCRRFDRPTCHTNGCRGPNECLVGMRTARSAMADAHLHKPVPAGGKTWIANCRWCLAGSIHHSASAARDWCILVDTVDGTNGSRHPSAYPPDSTDRSACCGSDRSNRDDAVCSCPSSGSSSCCSGTNNSGLAEGSAHPSKQDHLAYTCRRLLAPECKCPDLSVAPASRSACGRSCSGPFRRSVPASRA